MNNWTLKDLQGKEIAQVNGTYQKLVADKPAKVKKLPDLLERAGVKKGNAKVKNATKVTIDGVSFDSKLEAYMYELLKGAGIAFEFQKVIVVQPKFKYGGKVIRDIKCKIDFWLPTFNCIIDTKGHATDISILKYKLLKYFYYTKEQEPEVYMPSCKPECNFLINKLFYGNNHVTK